MREPSRAQCEAVCHRDGPALLIAGPGSGKTFTIVNRIRNLIEKEKIPPENILVVTFSKAAAKEMQDRFLLESNEYGVHFGTFHSLAYYILKNSFGFNKSSLLSDLEKRNMLSHILKNNGFSELCTVDFLSDFLGQISKIKNSNHFEKVILKSNNEKITSDEMLIIYEQFSGFLKENERIDFDDMIIICLKMLRANATILNEYNERFRYILVDEFQDINPPQYELIKLLAAPLNNLFVVGDDDQSIYKFRGSTPGIMVDFQNDYKNVKNIYLTENYRCLSSIVQFADKVIAKNKNRISKQFKPINEGGKLSFRLFDSRRDEEEFLLSYLKSKDTDLNETAVILRTNMEVSIYTHIIKRENLPVFGENVKSKSVFDSFVLEDIMHFLQFIFEGESRNDFLKIMNKPNRFFQRNCFVNNKVSKEDILRFYEKNEEMKKTVLDYFNKIELAKKMCPKLSISIFRKSLGYDRYLRSISKSQYEYQDYLKYANEVEYMFEDYKFNESVKEYIDMKNYEKKDIKINTNSKGIRILTMHSSKGLEFSNVIIPDVNEGIIPTKGCDKDELEEERRLLYVAITRAKNNLLILATKERNRKISRFIDGLV